MNIIIFGTGSTAKSALKQIDLTKQNIVAITDNDQNKWGKEWNGFKIINPDQLSDYSYDFILICSMYTEEIIETILKKGISRKSIVPYFDNLDFKKILTKDEKIRNKIFCSSENNKIALVTRRNSGCNCRALYKFKPKNINENFEVSLLNLTEYKNQWESFGASITTHLEGRFYKNKFNIESWHGFPIKSLGLIEKNRTDNIANVDKGIDYIISYSNLYSYIMSSVYKIDITKFIVTGMPRNDFLLNYESKNLISKLINKDIKNKKIIFYVPTFRRRKDKENWEGNNVISDFEDFKLIDEYLNEINGYLIVKKHPVEREAFNENIFNNIFFLEDLNLQELKIDFYEILGGSDLLITDYSSVYFDYLLLNKPIIFWLKDQKVYEHNRGFLFENVDQLMPGPKVELVSDLLSSISRSMREFNWYADDRNNVKKLVHKYEDFHSSQRVWEIFQNKYNKQFR